MRWSTGDRSNVQDMRGRSGMSLGRGLPIGAGGLLLLMALSWVTGVDLTSMVGGSSGAGGAAPSAGDSAPVAASAEEEKMVDFVDAVMRDAQAVWTEKLGRRYQQTRAVLFRDAINSACGYAQSATGPFYCPGDNLVYLDLGFFRELDDKLGAPGDFAQAYVLAHELGHHVQSVLGIERMMREQQMANPSQKNALSVRLELQADCLAGIWGHTAARKGRAQQGLVELEPGDVEEGLKAASQIGDDRLQRMSRGHVSPESFTHGSSAQRVAWFRKGLESGNLEACDTFGDAR